MAAMTNAERQKEFEEYAKQYLADYDPNNEDELTEAEYREGFLEGIYDIQVDIDNEEHVTCVSLCLGWGGPTVWLDFYFDAVKTFDCDYGTLQKVVLRSNVIDYAHQIGWAGGMQEHTFNLDESKKIYYDYEAVFDSDVLAEYDSEEAANG